MGNFCAKCLRRWRFRDTTVEVRYSRVKDASTEESSLMTNDTRVSFNFNPVSEEEKKFVKKKEFSKLVSYQEQVDKDIDLKLMRQERSIQEEEERRYAALRAAAMKANYKETSSNLSSVTSPPQLTAVSPTPSDMANSSAFMQATHEENWSQKTLDHPSQVVEDDGEWRFYTATGGANVSPAGEDGDVHEQPQIEPVENVAISEEHPAIV